MSRSFDLGGAVLLAIAALLGLPGLLAFVSPEAFYEQLAGYPPRNDHFIRDLGAFQIGLALFALVAWRRAELRRAAFAILAIHYALHLISHIIDVGDTDPAWQGPFALVVQAAATVVLVGLFLREQRT